MGRGPIKILYFAWLRERVGLSEEDVDLPEGIGTVGALQDWLRGRSPRHAAGLVTGMTIRCAVNQEFAGPDETVRPGDEVAFFPPVTGG
jgi:molybdopterin synthase sulfur carrier subunit